MADDDVKKINVVSASGDDQFAGVKAELTARFELLPEEIRQTLVDDNYQKKLFDISKAQKLTFEELGALEIETTMVLLGMTKPEEFRDDLQIALKKNDPETDTLVAAVNEQVFAPIRASLEKLFAAKKEQGDYIANPGSAASALTPAPAEKPVAPAPLPSTPVVPAAALSVNEKTVLAKTGVVISETPTMTPMKAPVIPSRDELMKGIENPPAAPSASLVGNKLGGMGTVMPTKTTDYSIPKPPPQAGAAAPAVAPAPRASDPYRESI